MKIYRNSHPERNMVSIFQKYISLLPPNGKNPSLYKHSLPKFSVKPNQWYADKPVGINLLKKTVKNLAEKGGLVGHFTNHSLHSSYATHMYNAGVDKQLIIETTGHKSECVRQYKWTSEDLLRAVQETVSNFSESKKVKTVPSCTVSKPPDDGFREEIIEVKESDWFDQNVLNEAVEVVTYKVNTEGKPSRVHKNPCPVN